MMRIPGFLKQSAVLIALLGLTACQAQKKAGPDEKAQSQMSKLLSRAAQNAEASGNTKKSLAFLGQVYRRNSDKPEAALRYARALRKADKPGKAIEILQGFSDRHESLDSLTRIRINSELALIHLGKGNFHLGQKRAQAAINTGENHDDSDTAKTAAKAYHLLGVAFDAQGQHEKAEKAFRKGLKNWKGDPVPIMNNLALNLANQDNLDEAVKILKKARKTAPDRKIVERNLRILTTMNEEVAYNIPPPLPSKKPGTQHNHSRDTKKQSAGMQ
jgi:Flp pilus assembly protein TadD